ncbi:MAG: hypothetical protein MUP21_13530 [Dehalococcoidia bacterium]|nr:hypothetical protein [Dehalococcoidia bacterium]
MTKLEELKTLVDAARAKKTASSEFLKMYEEKLQLAKATYFEDDTFHFAKQLEYEAELKRLGVLG